MARKSTGKKLRFQVFQRDAFTCQYCGKRPPQVILHIDHIIPVSKGGKDQIDNLITACSDCNLGKSNRNLSDFPERAQLSIEQIKERKEQLKAFYKYQEELQQMNESAVTEIDMYWHDLWDGKFYLTTQGEGSIRYFLKFFTKEEIKEAMWLSMRIDDVSQAFRYMCGILHKRRKERYGEGNN